MIEPYPELVRRREDFPMLSQMMHGHPLVYFDSAATAQKPQCVIDAINDFYSKRYGTVHRAIYELSVHATHQYQTIREKLRTFINAHAAQEVIYTRGTTESINMVAYSFGKAFVTSGDEILISTIEHHSNIVPWQIMCEDRGATLKVIPVNDSGEIILEEYGKLLSDKTKLVAVNHVSNALGTVNPVKVMATMAHNAGAKILIDGAQAAPHLPVDVQDINADFYVFSGHKLYGPTGIGILYGKRELLEAMPPQQGGGDMIREVTFEKTVYGELPLKFEAGTPMIAEVLGLGAAIDYIQSIGIRKIEEREHNLLEYATDKILEISEVEIIGTAKEKGAIISMNVTGVHHLDIGTMLDLKGIALRTGHHCAQPTMCRFGITGTARASLAFYNTTEEIDRFVSALKEVIATLRG